MQEINKIAEFIGIMLGDGSIGIYNTKAGNKIKVHRVVKVTLDSRNREYSSHVATLFKEVLGIEPHFRYKKNENAVDISLHKKSVLEYVINNLGLEVSPKWEKMKIPTTYTKGKIGLYVLKGLFDTVRKKEVI